MPEAPAIITETLPDLNLVIIELLSEKVFA